MKWSLKRDHTWIIFLDTKCVVPFKFSAGSFQTHFSLVLQNLNDFPCLSPWISHFWPTSRPYLHHLRGLCPNLDGHALINTLMSHSRMSDESVRTKHWFGVTGTQTQKLVPARGAARAPTVSRDAQRKLPMNFFMLFFQQKWTSSSVRDDWQCRYHCTLTDRQPWQKATPI